ncbi:locomotion-related protein Hikaru genki [Trichonephila inaurata madagascariensis]|uniref:Locomotion-related protein Hikaru genki n=1 Tax=Trichonephila inaurata madagascariensis TaxID=2747483 RepID=A0A8X6XUK1_9ARAC|nr:locomotion-related protein Hikaru genki [Trichonephila inaurata madagascariensis]
MNSGRGRFLLSHHHPEARDDKHAVKMKTSLLLLLFVFLAVEGQRVAIRRRPPKKRPTPKPKSAITNPAEDIHGNLPPGSIEQTVSREGCSAPEVIVNGSFIPDGNTDFSTVQEIHFVGLIGRRGQKRECKIKCLNGVWVGPMCTEGGNPIKKIMRRCTLRLTDAELVGVTDDNRPIPPDAEVSLPHDTEVRFRCVEPGLYKFVGNDSSLCDDGTWTSDLPYCVATTMHRNFSLQAPPTILYHVVSGDAGLAENGSIVVFPGTIINIDCLFQRQLGSPQWEWTPTQRQYPSAWAIPAEEKNWKFRLSIYYAKDYDSGTYTCITPHDISNEVNIIVKAITCQPPVTPLNGRVIDSGRYLAGDFVQYTCNAGHVIVGESVAICTDHGVWSQPPPKCKAACEFPGEPSNGQVIPTKFHYDIGEVVMVGCHPGFRILGFQRLQCTSSSHWSSPLPHCRPYLVQS